MSTRFRLAGPVAAFASAAVLVSSAFAHAPSGAIFTTLPDGSEVNVNLFPSKDQVYLDGGPGPGAPQTAAGLDDGTYVFQVTDPSGKTLLSTDPARCRQFVVSGGVITGVVDNDCEHLMGNDVDHPPARTVQLIPFKDTPNNGGVYKVWVTRLEDFLLGCQELGKPGTTGLNVVDCGTKTGGNAHGFIPSHSKTDNFKVKKIRTLLEIDTRFFRDRDGDGHITWDAFEQDDLVPGLQVAWQDTLGVSNTRFADPNYFYGTFAHVEAPETGTHYITVIGGSYNGKACTIGLIHMDDIDIGSGPGTVVPVTFTSKDPYGTTHFVNVAVTGC